MTATRRAFLAQAGATAFGLAFWQRAAHAAATAPRAAAGPYGALRAADASGLMLPEGFSSRVIARSLEPVPGTGFRFPQFPDGAASFPLPGGGWVHVVNAEIPAGDGGASAIRFAPDGRITGAQRILAGTTFNCSGGPTPWGTWLSCEEIDDGRVWECDPTGATPAVVRPALGVFVHEAACVDPGREHVYLTEDRVDGCLYRFVADAYPSLARGELEVAVAGDGAGRVAWRRVPDPSAAGGVLRHQVPGALRFARAEGIWFDDGIVYVATTEDDTIHALDPAAGTLSVLLRRADVPGSPLQGVDNLTVSRSGDVFVCEDHGEGPLDVCVISREGEVAPFLRLADTRAAAGALPRTELTGVSFDPSGTRMYVGSQRGAPAGGVLYEVSGPFRLDRPAGVRPAGQAGGGAAPAPAAAAPVGPALAVEAARRRRIATVLRQGLPVSLTLAERAEVTVAVTARMTIGGRRRRVLLARRRLRLGPGPASFRVPLRSRAARALLRRRRASLRAELDVRVGHARTRRTTVLVAR